MEENKKVNYFDIIFKIILIVIIIILLLHNCQMIKKINNSNDKKDIIYPTGNVDVFEIKCERETCKEVLPDKIDINPPVVNPQPTNPDNKEDENVDITVLDTIEWNSQNELRIFSNTLYEMEPKIAPESSNTYEFIIRNNTKYKIKYNIDFEEINNKNINMKYRLRKDNSYVVGSDTEWVTYDELDLKNILEDANSDHIYYLQWKWFSGDNDAAIGNDPSSKYKLNIKITAESQNE